MRRSHIFIAIVLVLSISFILDGHWFGWIGVGLAALWLIWTVLGIIEEGRIAAGNPTRIPNWPGSRRHAGLTVAQVEDAYGAEPPPSAWSLDNLPSFMTLAGKKLLVFQPDKNLQSQAAQEAHLRLIKQLPPVLPGEDQYGNPRPEQSE